MARRTLTSPKKITIRKTSGALRFGVTARGTRAPEPRSPSEHRHERDADRDDRVEAVLAAFAGGLTPIACIL